MISVQEAKAILATVKSRTSAEYRPLETCIGLVLAEDSYAGIDIPAFNQSSVDGYAVKLEQGPDRISSWRVVAHIAAGSSEQVLLAPGEAARVFTGAPIPEGADTVIMQEMIQEHEGAITLMEQGVQPGDNFRPAGSEITRNELALPAGTVITASSIGFLAGLGISELPVYAAPSIALLITGNELQTPGKPLQAGQVYESSSYTLLAELRQAGIHDITVTHVKDNLPDTVQELSHALATADMVLITGGVSVGDYDFVVPAATACGVTTLFHRIRQRPGKPLYAGLYGSKVVFGLPGNPSSVLTCYYQYVWPMLRLWQGHSQGLRKLQVPLAAGFNKKIQLTQFLKGHYQHGCVTLLTAQESYRMRSYAVANCLVELDEAVKTYEANEIVNIYLLPVYG